MSDRKQQIRRILLDDPDFNDPELVGEHVGKLEPEDVEMEVRDTSTVYVNPDTLQQRIHGIPGRRFTTSGSMRFPRLGSGYLTDNQQQEGGGIGGFNYSTASRGQYGGLGGGGRGSFGVSRGAEAGDELVSENARLVTENRLLFQEIGRISHEIEKYTDIKMDLEGRIQRLEARKKLRLEGALRKTDE